MHDESHLVDTEAVAASSLMRLEVSTQEEGAKLGHVTHVLCDRNRKAVIAIGFRENIFKDEYLVRSENIKKIGRDLLVISSESCIESMPKHLPDGQIFLRSFTGTPIASLAGNALGKLSDIAIDRDSWYFQRLYFDHHHWLEVTPDTITIGPDQILVPAGSTDQIVEEKADPGWRMSKAFEKETYQHLGETFQRSFRQRKDDEEGPHERSAPEVMGKE